MHIRIHIRIHIHMDGTGQDRTGHWITSRPHAMMPMMFTDGSHGDDDEDDNDDENDSDDDTGFR